MCVKIYSSHGVLYLLVDCFVSVDRYTGVKTNGSSDVYIT